MLDKTTLTVLNTLNEQNSENKYVVLPKETIISGFKKKKQPDEDTLKGIINYLDEREYIKLKYADDGKYCLTVLPKGRLINENKKEEKLRLKKENSRQLFFLFKVLVVASISSFAGSIAGYIAINYFL